MTPIIFTHPEYRTLAFKRSGIKNLHPFDKQLRGKIIREYEDLPFDPDSLIAPSSLHKRRSPAEASAEASALQPNPLTLNEVASGVLRNQFIDFGDPDHLALIRLDGLVLMKLVAILARREHHTEIRLPNFVLDFRDLTTETLTLREQLDFLNQHIPLTCLTRPPLRTYEEIVDIASRGA